jgi:putative phosphoesterase
MGGRKTVVGLISDTHGLVRSQAVDALRGSELIIHAGDIGKPEVIDQLRVIAHTIAVRGNVDIQAWAAEFPMTEAVKVGERVFWVLHEISQLDLDPAAAGFAAVVYGHSHQPSIERREGVLYINPGSAGPRRFNLPVTVARVSATGREIYPEIINLEV